MQYQWTTFPTVGYISTQFTADQLQPIRDEVTQIQADFDHESNNPANRHLLGQLHREYSLKNVRYIEELMIPLAMAYNQEFNYFSLFEHFKNPGNLIIDHTWVNFQQKHEFNPPHRHSGILSFVIWLKIPYDLELEKQICPGRTSGNPLPGSFAFSYSNPIGLISNHYLPIDRSMEGTAIIFPSSFIHEVFPFYTTDDYRISVAGNFVFDNRP